MFGVNLFLWTAAYTDSEAHLIPMVKELGFDCVEIPLISLMPFLWRRRKHFLRKTGLR